MINVSYPYLPSPEEYNHYLRGIWERNWLTNNGPLVQELEARLRESMEVEFLQFTSNGTVPLQFAIKALDLKGEIITTPFSYVATTGAILWEGCKPVFADIEPETFCIDPDRIEALITEKTSAILATHVYGFPCDVIKIDEIARKHGLKVIYDGAHAFGVKVNGRSIFSYGDISTCSFHATKLFHTVEGGAIICSAREIHDKVTLYKSFGHIGDEYIDIGINGKNSEFHAAMGLCNLPKVPAFIEKRKEISERYKELLSGLDLRYPAISPNIEYNYSYFPVLFKSEAHLLKVKDHLTSQNINTRRYFFPSLNQLPYLPPAARCPVSEDISRRVLCLPFYQQLSTEQISFICSKITEIY